MLPSVLHFVKRQSQVSMLLVITHFNPKNIELHTALNEVHTALNVLLQSEAH